jgi:hypothetical protein
MLRKIYLFEMQILHAFVDFILSFTTRRVEKAVEESSWKTRELHKQWLNNYSLDYENIRKHHLQKTMGELMHYNGLDSALSAYQYARPEFKIGQKIPAVDLEIMRMNRFWVSGLGPEGFEERFHGVLIFGRCRSCGNPVEGHYGCPVEDTMLFLEDS